MDFHQLTSVYKLQPISLCSGESCPAGPPDDGPDLSLPIEASLDPKSAPKNAAVAAVHPGPTD